MCDTSDAGLAGRPCGIAPFSDGPTGVSTESEVSQVDLGPLPETDVYRLHRGPQGVRTWCQSHGGDATGDRGEIETYGRHVGSPIAAATVPVASAR